MSSIRIVVLEYHDVLFTLDAIYILLHSKVLLSDEDLGVGIVCFKNFVSI